MFCLVWKRATIQTQLLSILSTEPPRPNTVVLCGTMALTLTPRSSQFRERGGTWTRATVDSHLNTHRPMFWKPLSSFNRPHILIVTPTITFHSESKYLTFQKSILLFQKTASILPKRICCVKALLANYANK